MTEETKTAAVWRLKAEPRGHIRSTIEWLNSGQWEEALITADASQAAMLVVILNSLEADREQLARVIRLGQHLSHCNLGELVDLCKYGELSECPALSESWSWFGRTIADLRARLAAEQKANLAERLAETVKDIEGRLRGPAFYDDMRLRLIAGIAHTALADYEKATGASREGSA